jgi:anti-sigma B factor antagonist
MKLDYAHNTLEDGIVLVTLSGRMSAVTIGDFKIRLKKLIAETDGRIVVDLEKVDFIDSSGLSLFISALKSARDKGGFLRLLKIQPAVRHVFEMTLLDRVFQIHSSLEAAVASGTEA